ncbi:hypothetical protein L228DRAFT_241763 [Xylona heveae TC161]|uniref:Uncharacterized protein n=1 Tax=Xylona heveae (strain CBS 132557 / TC161) TaxID=1328760 RepID=A0A164ZUN1_XYLHT|nr:hypothetical protein L228DRAFT_241763 [Xylona heveae TC161]KZF19550.1 hypothetical protein L228DRAFT_241763 [Xylona heveae TC161]
MSLQSYKVYKVQYRLGFQDPAFVETRYHTVVFVETDADGGGWTHEVTGDIVSTSGMVYQSNHGSAPDKSETYHQKLFLGWIAATEHLTALDNLLRSLPPPPRQRWFNPKTMIYEQCRPDGTLYGPNETRPPYRKCTEWTEQQAIPAMLECGLLRTETNPK